jgi:hypothetical protein
LAALPAVAILGVGAFTADSVAGVFGLALGGAGIVLCGIVRDLGRRLQPRLWESWGGSPSVQRLRFRGAADPPAVARLHARIGAVLGFELPDETGEAERPGEADVLYDEAVAALRELTRDSSRFPLIFTENAEYGFRRNALGLRWIGLGLALVAVVVGVVALLMGHHHDSAHLVRWVIPIALGGGCAVFWLVIVRPQWVRRAGELYADRLFEAVVGLERDD